MLRPRLQPAIAGRPDEHVRASVGGGDQGAVAAEGDVLGGGALDDELVGQSVQRTFCCLCVEAERRTGFVTGEGRQVGGDGEVGVGGGDGVRAGGGVPAAGALEAGGE